MVTWIRDRDLSDNQHCHPNEALACSSGRLGHDENFGVPLMDPWYRSVPKLKELTTESRVEPAKLTTSALTPIDTLFYP